MRSNSWSGCQQKRKNLLKFLLKHFDPRHPLKVKFWFCLCQWSKGVRLSPTKQHVHTCGGCDGSPHALSRAKSLLLCGKPVRRVSSNSSRFWSTPRPCRTALLLERLPLSHLLPSAAALISSTSIDHTILHNDTGKCSKRWLCKARVVQTTDDPCEFSPSEYTRWRAVAWYAQVGWAQTTQKISAERHQNHTPSSPNYLSLQRRRQQQTSNGSAKREENWGPHG